jgi:hypothetical protein
LEEINALLLRVPGLVRILDERGSDFVGAVKAWLAEAERILQNNRLPAAAEIAGLRGQLISAERGVIPAGLAFTGRPTTRKVREATAADVLKKAEAAIANAIREDSARHAEGERLAQQIVAAAQRKGIVPGAGRFPRRGDLLSAIWRALSADKDVGQATTHLAGLVGTQDAMILLDQKLPPET